MSAPTVSVIMPCHNGRPFVARSVGSVIAQRFPDFELIFVDDASSDGSSAAAAAVGDSRVRLTRIESRSVSVARNTGVAQARGRFIAFLDVDDNWHADFLNTMADALERHPEAALAYCGWQNVGLPGGRSEPYVPRLLDGTARPDELIAACPWPIHAALTRAEALRAAGGFEPSLAVGEDFLLWLEIACFKPIVRVPQVLAYYQHHGAGQASGHALRSAMQPFAAQQIFLARHSDVRRRLGRHRVRELTFGRVLRKGYDAYWRGDLDTARAIFRVVIRNGYGSPRDWLYMLPSLLPRALHRHALGAKRAFLN